MARVIETEVFTNDLGNFAAMNKRVIAVLQELIKLKGAVLETRRSGMVWKLLFFLGCFVSFSLIVAEIQSAGRHFIFSIWLYAGVLSLDLLGIVKVRSSLLAAQKALVNFGVVRHHLVGMIEVGSVCICTEECDCKARLRRQVLIEHGISLY